MTAKVLDSHDEKLFLRALIDALRSPRNRFGRIEPSRATCEAIHAFVRQWGSIPHGGADTLDKAQMILSLMIGDKPISIQDMKP